MGLNGIDDLKRCKMKSSIKRSVDKLLVLSKQGQSLNDGQAIRKRGITMNPANGTTLEELKKCEPLEIKDTVMLRMSKIVDKLIEDNEIFRNIDKSALKESLSTLVEKAPEKLISLTDDELTRRIETVLVIEAAAGMLQDLTPDKMSVFEESVKRRKFFK